MQETGSIPESGRSPGVGNGNPFQYSFLENPMDRGAWQATVPGAAKTVCRSPLVPLDGRCVSEEEANRTGTQDS